MSRILIDTDWLPAAIESGRTLTSVADELGIEGTRSLTSRVVQFHGLAT